VALTWDFSGIDAAATEFRDSALLAPGCKVRTPAAERHDLQNAPAGAFARFLALDGTNSAGGRSGQT
jgi:hypothetical protein